MALPKKKLSHTIFPRIAGAIVALMGGAVLVIWALDIDALKYVQPWSVTMKPITAAGFVLAGVSLWLSGLARDASADQRRDWIRRSVGQICAGSVALIGLLALGTIVFGWSLGIDQILLDDQVGTAQTFSPGQMTPTTAFNLVLVGLALFAILWRGSNAKTAQILVLASLVTSFLSLTGYVLGVKELYGAGFQVAMALSSSILFIILGAGVLWSTYPSGFAVLTLPARGSVGGRASALLLAAAIALPVGLGWLWLQGINAGLYATDFGVAMLVLSVVVVSVSSVLLIGHSIEQQHVVRVRAVTAELQQEEVYRQLFESMPDPVISVNREGVIVRFNSQAEKVFGYSKAEMLGQPVEMLMPGRFRDRHVGLRGTYMATPKIRPMGPGLDLFGQRKDGSEFAVEISLSPMETAEGLLAVSVVRDVTERKQAESRIHRQIEHLSLLDHITRATGERQDLKSIYQVVVRSLEERLPIDFGCICMYDAVSHVLTVSGVGVKSEALARELTMDGTTTIGVDDNGLGRCVQGQLVYEPDISQVLFPFPEQLARAGLGSLVMAPLKSESRVLGVLVAARRGANAFISVECEFLRQLSEHVALAANQAQLYGALQTAYDELRQTQQAMLQEERMRVLGQMASGIAHDINNALSPVSLYAESMLETEKNLSERGRGYLQIIQRSVEDVAQTVARMREFYRPREAQLGLTPVQLNGMVQQVVELTRARWSDQPLQSGIVIRALTALTHDLPKIMGVEGEIREALTNLVFNAVDAMPTGGTLTLRTRVTEAGTDRAAVVVEVTDNGAGMDEDTQARCLEPFFTTKGERGTGLGLAMVFGMVQRHSGEIEIESTPGAGTTVRLVFAVPATITAEPGQPAYAPRMLSRLRLLLVDDDPILLRSLRDALEADAHVIVTANGGEEGIVTFRMALDRGESFAAVITDLGMPYIDGRRVAAAVKEMSPTTPVIMLTGWGRRLISEGDIPPHVDRVLAKPPKLRELREALAELCRPAAA